MVKEHERLVIVIQHVVELVKWRRRSLYTSFTLTCQSTLKLALLDILALRGRIVSFQARRSQKQKSDVKEGRNIWKHFRGFLEENMKECDFRRRNRFTVTACERGNTQTVAPSSTAVHFHSPLLLQHTHTPTMLLLL